MTQKKGILFIIAAPSGAGKTSLIKALVTQIENVKVSISYTTRRPRKEEKEGEDYYFINENDFEKMINENSLLEYARVFNNYYGTSLEWVEKELTSGNNIILEIDWQGTQQIKGKLGSSVAIFILPPDYHSLRERLINRRTDAQEIINFRMQAAKENLSHYKEFDFIVINDNFEKALDELKAIITAINLHRCHQSAFFANFVNQIVAGCD